MKPPVIHVVPTAKEPWLSFPASLPLIRYLHGLVGAGLHGADTPGVLRTLVEEGIRAAIKDGLLPVRESN